MTRSNLRRCVFLLAQMGKRGFTHFKRAKAAWSGSEAALEDEGIELEDLRAREVALQT